MSTWNYKTGPAGVYCGLYGGATVVASNQGWVNSLTGEVLVPIGGLTAKKADADAAPTFTLGLPANATYATGQVMTFTVTASEPVTVVGTPSIALTLTSGVVLAAFDAVNSTSTSLLFKYTVKAGDTALSGITVANILTLTAYPGNGTDKVIDQIPNTCGQIMSPSALTYTVGSTTLIRVQGV